MLSRLKKSKKGFTLIELMIVVAIIGILAAIAIPAFIKYIKQSKTSEARINLKAMADGASAYYQKDHYNSTGLPIGTKQFPATATATVPGDVPPGTKSVATVTGEPWASLNFELPKAVYYAYGYTSTGTGDDSVFTGSATGDLDGDDTDGVFQVRGSTTNGTLQISEIFPVDPANEFE